MKIQGLYIEDLKEYNELLNILKIDESTINNVDIDSSLDIFNDLFQFIEIASCVNIKINKELWFHLKNDILGGKLTREIFCNCHLHSFINYFNLISNCNIRLNLTSKNIYFWALLREFIVFIENTILSIEIVDKLIEE